MRFLGSVITPLRIMTTRIARHGFTGCRRCRHRCGLFRSRRCRLCRCRWYGPRIDAIADIRHRNMFAFMLALMFAGLPIALTIGVRRHRGSRPRVIVVHHYGLRFGSLGRAISVLLRCLRNRSFRGEPVQRSMGVTIVGRSRLFVRRVGLLTVGIIGILRPL